jgi:molybdopterin molybdotransferase
VLTFDEALATILADVPPAPVVEVPLDESAGLVLARELVADADMPAFDRSAMDGYAVRAEDLTAPGAALRRVGEVKTGGPAFTRALGRGECAAIYTGAPIPAGADAVVMVERTKAAGDSVRFEAAARPGENVRRRGEDVKRGELLLTPGTTIRPQEIAACATFGAPRVLVHPRPAAAVLSTGDELVAPSAAPGPGQIRDSNGAMLAAQARRAGAALTLVKVVRDDRAAIRDAIEEAAARARVLILTGGVSMGAHDYVAPVLAEAGFAGGFHKVRVKPGKPVWYGRRAETLAFGLPGNPVSSFVMFELLVRPAVDKLLGRAPGPRFEAATVRGGPVVPGDREQFVPARVDDVKNLTFLPWTSSADFVELCRANALARVPVQAAPKPGDPIAFVAI